MYISQVRLQFNRACLNTWEPKLANSSQNCHDVATHCDTLSICTVLYHYLHKELPHIYTANSLLLMQQPKDKSAFPLLFS